MADPFVGQQLANFRIDHLVKVGENSRIYYGWDVTQRRPVAVKLLEVSAGGDGRFADTFVRQAREMLSGWWHEHVTQVYYTARENGRYYVVTEYVDGLNLKELMAQYGVAGELMPLKDVTRIGWAVAKALDYAHEQGVVHRDVKPANVMLSADNRILLTDFGLAPPITNDICGTPTYIAPELAQNPTVADPSADLYSLAVMLYEMVVGRPPFQAETAVELLHLQTSAMPPRPHNLNPHLNRQVDKVLLKALNKSPQKRYPSGATLMQALEDSLGAGAVDIDDTGELPPLPAVVVQTEEAPTLSDIPIVDKIAAQLDMEDRQVMRQRWAEKQRRRRGTWGCVVAIAVIMGLAAWGVSAMRSNDTEVTATPMMVAVATE
jgi:serine/threonine-protein kinase